ncbi:hypothetical protein ACFL5O_08395 [Myxococcota bacterium]
MESMVAVCWLSGCLGCDGLLVVKLTVLDEQGIPITNAGVRCGDIILDEELARYVRGEGELSVFPRHTDSNGQVTYNLTLAGPGEHEAWVVARKAGLLTGKSRVWCGNGFPERNERSVLLVLKPEASTDPETH